MAAALASVTTYMRRGWRRGHPATSKSGDRNRRDFPLLADIVNNRLGAVGMREQQGGPHLDTNAEIKWQIEGVPIL
jgi:hypothetical protein